MVGERKRDEDGVEGGSKEGREGKRGKQRTECEDDRRKKEKARE